MVLQRAVLLVDLGAHVSLLPGKAVVLFFGNAIFVIVGHRKKLHTSWLGRFKEYNLVETRGKAMVTSWERVMFSRRGLEFLGQRRALVWKRPDIYNFGIR